MLQKFLVAIFFCTFPLVAYVSTLPAKRFQNRITEWGNPSSQTYQQFQLYRQQFGANRSFVVSWPGCRLTDSRVNEVTDRVRRELGDWVTQVSSGNEIYWRLRDDARLSEPEALSRMSGAFLDRATLTTAVMFNLTDQGQRHKSQVVVKLTNILQVCGVDPDTAALAGLGHNLYSLDQEGLTSPFRMVPWIMLLAFALTVWFVRHFWLAFFVNALGTYTGCLAFNGVYIADVDMNAIIWPLPTLTMLLTVSAALHFLSYVRQAAESVACRPADLTRKHVLSPSALWDQRRRRVVRRAWRSAVLPNLCCTLTTAMGLISLLLSTSGPVRQFGFFGAISVVSANLILLLVLPAFLCITNYVDHCVPIADGKTSRPDRTEDIWGRLARFNIRFRQLILFGFAFALVLCGIGVFKVKTGSQLQNFFPRGHRVLRDVAQIESSMPLNSIELLLEFEHPRPNHDRLRIRKLRQLSQQIVEATPLESTVSAATFAPVFKRSSGVRDRIQQARIREWKQKMVDAGLVHRDPGLSREVWRISCRYKSNNPLSIDQCREQVSAIAKQVFYRDDRMIFADERLSTVTTGEFVLFDEVDRQFFRELMITYATAFTIISIVVAVVLRCVRTCLIAILPNVFPAVVVLGTVGYLGLALDAASLMTASVALGIAVDDTLHFLLWRKKCLEKPNVFPLERSPSVSIQRESNFNRSHGPELKDKQTTDARNADAIETTIRYCGRAMWQTSMILGGSICLYTLCGFLPTVRFGGLLSAMMLAALLGDLFLLPALLGRSSVEGPATDESRLS